MTSSRIKPVLLVDEAQEMSVEVLSELRILSSADFDATSLLTVVLSRRRPAPGTVAASRPGAAGNPDPHAAAHRSRLARGTLRTAEPRLGQGRQRHADDAPNCWTRWSTTPPATTGC